MESQRVSAHGDPQESWLDSMLSLWKGAAGS